MGLLRDELGRCERTLYSFLLLIEFREGLHLFCSSAVVRLSGLNSCAGLGDSHPFWSVDEDLGGVVRVDL